METKVISTPKAPAALGPYVQARQAGNLLFSSGQLGLIPETGELPEGIEAQTKQALANIQAILDEAGFTRENVVKSGVYITDMNDFAKVNAIYADFFGDHKPARSCVEVSAMAKGALIEIEVYAVK